MIQALIGHKIDQTQSFLENGQRIPVTEISVADNVVVQVKTEEKDTYTAIQLGVGVKKKPIKARVGHSKKAGLENVPVIIREVAWAGDEELPKAGDIVTVETVFKPGDIIKVTGTSKGKGFAGAVKRYNFRGGPKTHGQSDRHRAPGSIGQGTTPGRVYKGKKMAGHMGVETVTVSNLTVVAVDPETNKLYVSGLVPGNKKAAIVITKTGEEKKFVRLLSVKQKEEVQVAQEAERLAKEQEQTTEDAAKVEVQAAEEAATTLKETVADTAEAVKEDVKSDTSDVVNSEGAKTNEEK